MDKNLGNYDSTLHDEDYELPFSGKELLGSDLIFISGRRSESLNGLWHYAMDQYDTALRQSWYKEKKQTSDGRDIPLDYDFDTWETMQLPSCWNLVKERYFHYEGSVIFTRTFKLKREVDKKVYIRVGAASYEAKIFINGSFAGRHRGASTPFFADITEYVKEKNRIIIVVENKRKKERVPALNTDWFNYGGIFRDIDIYQLPDPYIKDFFIRLLHGSDYKKIEVSVAMSNNSFTGTVYLEIEDLQINKPIFIENGKVSIVFSCTPELWSPENPKLYHVTVKSKGDSISDEVGFREISVSGSEILLNGKQIFLKGISAHEESVQNGRSVSEEEIIENMNLIKELNGNFMRLAHYPHTEKASKIADRMGILLWEEIPVYWAIDFGNTQTYQDAENQLTELIIRDRNRASVILWSVGNENPDTDLRLDFMKKLTLKARSLDNTRLITAACLVDQSSNMVKDRLSTYLDVVGVNEYYGWYIPDFKKLYEFFENSDSSKPVIISEMGGGAKAGVRGSIDRFFTEDNQREIYHKQINVLKMVVYVCGMTPWILFDFRSPRRTNSFQCGYNRKGLLSEDKSYRKLAFTTLKEFYSSI